MGYIRDARSPIPKNESTSRVMSANRAKNTGPEIEIRKALSRLGVKGYRLHSKNIPGRPDIAFRGKRFAVFIHGCFWHRCPKCKLPFPKTNTLFWKKKFTRNQERDIEKETLLRERGWQVLVLWECEVKRNPTELAKKIQAKLKKLSA